jgi:GNAT superfamily N-acetyltransferase
MSADTIDEIAIPATLDAPGAGEFVEAMAVAGAVFADALGSPDFDLDPAEELPQYQNPFEPRRVLAIRVDGRIVAVATTQTHTGEGADTSWVTVLVLPGFRRRGFGTALAERAEQLVRADGRVKAIAFVPGRDGSGVTIPSPTGFGTIRADAPETLFAQGRGYSFEQVARVSRLALPVEDLATRLAEATEASGADYAVHAWAGRTPEQWLEDRAVLVTRMSTDAPTAGLEEPEDVWTADRVRENDDRQERNPRTRLVAAAEHLPSGRLVAFSVLSVPAPLERAVHQYATLVLREHRGHRLGMLVKLANLAQLERVVPGHPSVITYNAEENRPMLDVNEAVGFVPIAHEGAWRKDLA